ncbi:polyubiquitin [Anaeramoeba flamelloides]|uniref:Polyubiquitin n=1 Tax=Anaeramoeba flamelloides TaxID=1746091 RepID=A0AAV7ZXY4_9EUKA|nr:polyubiquitin [Anaeramoeba flamelloides]
MFNENLDGKIQQCPNCKSFVPITNYGFGFKECNFCKNIFCFFCSECFGTFKEIQQEQRQGQEKKENQKYKAMIHFNVNHKGVDETFKTNNYNQFKAPNNYQIFIKNLSGRGYTIEANDYETIKQIKDKIFQATNYPISEKLRLIFAGKLLSENCMVCDYKIMKESTVHCIIKPRSASEVVQFKTLDSEVTHFVTKTKNDLLISTIQDEVFKKTGIQTENQFFLFNGQDVDLNKTFGQLDAQNGSTDLEIKGIKVHSLMIQTRTQKDANEIKLRLEQNCTKEEIHKFLNWVYGDQDFGNKKLVQIMKLIEMKVIPTNFTLMEDISNLWKDEDSKDFYIIIDEDENENENDEEKELGMTKIPVHKLILQARSQLFQTMFLEINENIKQVKDYSGKSPDTLEILFKYFYTNTIKLKADHDPQLILEELEDAKEYYQFNKNSVFDLELKKIQLKLKNEKN